MKPWLMAIIGRQRQLVTETFTSNAVWVASATTNKIETLSGKGVNGSPASSGYQYELFRTVIVVYDAPQYGENSQLTTSQGYVSGPVSAYCDPSTYFPADHATVTYCYATSQVLVEAPATTGTSATAFGSTFPGGVGGPATTTVIASPPAVTPGTSYTFNLPAGSTITFSYYK